MSGQETDFDPEKDLRVLEALAGRHAPSSAEYLAIELAAKALLFVHATGQAKGFGEYLREFHADLTAEQRELLGRLGLE